MAADGSEIGTAESLLGDESEDIFHGIEVKHRGSGKHFETPRRAPGADRSSKTSEWPCRGRLAIWAGAPGSASLQRNRTPPLIPHQLLPDDGDVILHLVLATGSRQRPGFGSHPVEELVFEGDHLPVHGDPVARVLPEHRRQVLALEPPVCLCTGFI